MTGHRELWEVTRLSGPRRAFLQGLGLANELRSQRLDDFQGLAQRVAERQGWRAVVLAGPAVDRFGRSASWRRPRRRQPSYFRWLIWSSRDAREWTTC